jgi:CRISPR-associated endonuclease Cas1
MFTHKDIEFRSIFVVNCIENRTLRVSAGELLLENTESNKTLTKLPFQKILAIFVIGHVSITTPLIDKCTKYGIPIIVMKPNLRPVFCYSVTAEANFLLREKQYAYSKENLLLPKVLVENKIENQIRLLIKTRIRTAEFEKTKSQCKDYLILLNESDTYEKVMGIEGKASRIFFTAFFAEQGWKSRHPRIKSDPLNATLDIGYTLLFNYIEAFVRLFGFDPYRGVYHQLWFKRKSLICDLMEPFRCIIDYQVRKAFNLGQCNVGDFLVKQGEYQLKREKSPQYTQMFYNELIKHKAAVFEYIRQFYRCFMQDKRAIDYPRFYI